MIKNLAKSIKKPTSKQVILLLVAGLALLLAAVAAWHIYAWQRYVAHNDSQYGRIQSSAMQQLSGAASADDIKQLTSDLARAALELCQPPPFTGLRVQLLTEARQYQDDCRQRQRVIEDAVAATQQLFNRLEGERHLAAVLTVAATDIGSTKDGDYAAQRKIWQQASDSTAELNLDDELTKLKAMQEEAISGLLASYDDLIKADKVERRRQFDDAVVELRSAYADLGAIGRDSTASYQQAAEKLFDAVADL